MSKLGIINYFNEMFLGKEELTKKQEMDRSNLLSILNIFGLRGLFDLKFQQAKFEIKATGGSEYQISLVFPDDTRRILGISGKQLLVCNTSSLSINQVLSTRPTYYLYLEPTTNSIEEGTITISNDGTVIGLGTKFTNLLRGGRRQSRIKVGSDIFTVSHVENDTLLYLQGVNFPAMFNETFEVLPTLSPFAGENDNVLYRYDSCQLGISESPLDEVSKFQIAKFAFADILLTGKISFSQITLLQGLLYEKSVGQAQLQEGSVGQAQLKEGSVGQAQLQNKSVGQAQLKEGSVGQAQLQEGSVGQAQLQEGSVGQAQLQDPFKPKIISNTPRTITVDSEIETRITLRAICILQEGYWLIKNLSIDGKVNAGYPGILKLETKNLSDGFPFDFYVTIDFTDHPTTFFIDDKNYGTYSSKRSLHLAKSDNGSYIII